MTRTADERSIFRVAVERKVGEIFDLAGRAVLAAFWGAWVLGELGIARTPRFGPGAVMATIGGIVLMSIGVYLQARAEASKEVRHDP